MDGGLLVDEERRILALRLRLIYGNVGATVVPTYLFGGLFFLLAPAARWRLGLWWAGIALSKTWAYVDARRRLRRPVDPVDAPRLARGLVVLHAVDGGLWGAIAWALFDHGATAGNVLVAAVYCGVIGSSVSLLSPIPSVFWAFSFAATAVALPRVWMVHDPNSNILVGAAAVYLLNVAYQARGSAAAARAAIERRVENAALVERGREQSAAANLAREQAEEANRAKSKFLAAASHDLRQPVHAQGMLIATLAQQELSPAQRDLLVTLQAAWLASADMLDALLDFSRIEAGVVRVNERPFRLGAVFSRLEGELSPEAEQKGLRFVARETNVVVRSDPALAERILRNLVVNAIRYTERGGVLVACRRRKGHAIVEVWDTGSGIAPENQQAIFREFHQLGNPQRDRRKGLGLGLAIADSLAKKLGHRITLASRVGRGSVFRVAFPISDEPIVPDDDALPARTERLDLRVLVIDDDELVRVAMGRLLTSFGCRAVAVDSFEAAVVAARAERPDVIISDYRLREERTGAEAILALRSELGARVPAFLVTGDTGPERLREAHRTGLPLLHKPLSPRVLERALREVTRSTNAPPRGS
jgi:signal transduction histidine kinase